MKLNLNSEFPDGAGLKSACVSFQLPTLTLTYTRSLYDAKIVEGLMGRDVLGDKVAVETNRHPVIELRLTPEHFVIELVVSPSAWWDQQNLVGLLTIKENRDKLFRILSSMSVDYALGFWGGVHLDDRHLNTDKLPPRILLFEYLDTFAARRDCWRLGRWYTPDDLALENTSIVNEAFERIRELYKVYDFIRWTNKNNYVSLYNKLVRR